MRAIYNSRAQKELLDIVRYYNENLPGLGKEFMEELDIQIELCCTNPEIGVPLGEDYRRLVMKRFPFSIIYRIRDKNIRVIAVAHQHRKPGYWLGRSNVTTSNKIKEPIVAYTTDLLKSETNQNKLTDEEKAHLHLWASATPGLAGRDAATGTQSRCTGKNPEFKFING